MVVEMCQASIDSAIPFQCCFRYLYIKIVLLDNSVFFQPVFISYDNVSDSILLCAYGGNILLILFLFIFIDLFLSMYFKFSIVLVF